MRALDCRVAALLAMLASIHGAVAGFGMSLIYESSKNRVGDGAPLGTSRQMLDSVVRKLATPARQRFRRMRSGASSQGHDKTATGLSRHENMFLSLAETAIDRRFEMPYRKTYPFDGDYINAQHEKLTERRHPSGMIDFGIDGWLLPADALKLYEMAYWCEGDILELGAYRGLSAAIMNEACNDSHRASTIISIDLDPSAIELSRQELESRPGGQRVLFFQNDGGSALRNLAGIKRQFRFAFVDQSHRYEHVLDACRSLHRVIAADGFVLFHDFNDPRNSHEGDLDYGVYQGVVDGLKIGRWEFWGIYGCSGLFRHVDPRRAFLQASG